MDKDFFMSNRKIIAQTMEDKSVLVMFAGRPPYKRGDELYKFTPDRNFYYITGIEEPNIMLIIHKEESNVKETLYIPRDNGYLAKWVGKNISKEEAIAVSNIENIRYVDEMEGDLAELIFKNTVSKLYLDLEKREWTVDHSPAVGFARKFTSRYPHVALKDIYGVFAKMRMIKTTEEIENICKAIEITKQGLDLMLRNLKPGIMEYELEAYFNFVITKNGVRDRAFETIIASGANATTLHYNSNNSKIGDNDLVLFDLGAQYKYYNADISRTFPAKGRFTIRQKEIYNIVLGGQNVLLKNMKVGVPFSLPNEKLKEYYAEELKRIGLIKEDKEVDEYFYHSAGHLLGLDTHDIGRNNEGTIKSGMVITAEPGLYIAKEKLGVRIEDDILITDKGAVNLSKNIIKSVDEIEDAMNKGAQ